MEKNLLGKRREPTTNSTHIWCQCRDLNPYHSGGHRIDWKKRVFLGCCKPVVGVWLLGMVWVLFPVFQSLVLHNLVIALATWCSLGNLTMLKKFTCRTFALNPPPPSLSKDWHLHNDNIFLIIFALAEFTNRIQSYPRMCLHHCHKNRFLPILLFVLLLSKVNNINPLSLLFTQNKSCILNSQSLIDHIVKRATCRKTR